MPPTSNPMETYYGHVRTPQDAIILFEACRKGRLPRVQRRLSEKERQSIRSGSVFVWDEREAGMRRWTDGKSWSASRVSGSFLTYREMEGRRGPGLVPILPKRAAAAAAAANKDPNKTDSDVDMTTDSPEGYRYKADGLIKQSFSITTADGQRLHLISYFARPHHVGSLQQPSQDPTLRDIQPKKGLYPDSTLQEQTIPAVTRAPMAHSPYMTSMSGQQPPSQPTSSPYQQTPPSSHHPYPGSPHGWPNSPSYTPPMSHYSPYYHSAPPAGTPSSAIAGPPPHPLTASHSPAGSTTYHSPHRSSPYGPPIYSPSVPPPSSGGPTAFDRLPPALSNTGLPPPPPMPAATNGAHQSPVPAAAARQSPHLSATLYTAHLSPRVSQAEILGQPLPRTSPLPLPPPPPHAPALGSPGSAGAGGPPPPPAHPATLAPPYSHVPHHHAHHLSDTSTRQHPPPPLTQLQPTSDPSYLYPSPQHSGTSSTSNGDIPRSSPSRTATKPAYPGYLLDGAAPPPPPPLPPAPLTYPSAAPHVHTSGPPPPPPALTARSAPTSATTTTAPSLTSAPYTPPTTSAAPGPRNIPSITALINAPDALDEAPRSAATTARTGSTSPNSGTFDSPRSVTAVPVGPSLGIAPSGGASEDSRTRGLLDKAMFKR